MTVEAPFAVTMDGTGQRVIDPNMYLTISRSANIEHSKRHFTSTHRFKPHSVDEANRSTQCKDIQGAQTETTRRFRVSHTYGTDLRETQAGVYKPQVQREIQAVPSLGHQASFTGLLGDAKLGHQLPHRSKSYNLTNKNNPSSLETHDVFGASPRQPSKFLLCCTRHTDPLAPKYQLPSCPPLVPLADNWSGRDSLCTTDLAYSAVDGEIRPVYGVGSSAERRNKIGSLNLDKTKTLGERPLPLEQRTGVSHGCSDIAGAVHSTARRMHVKHRFGRDDKNPLGNDTRDVNAGPSCPGLIGSSFRSTRHSNPLDPLYTVSMHSSIADVQTLRASHPPYGATWRPSTTAAFTKPLHPDVDTAAAKTLSPRSTYAPNLAPAASSGGSSLAARSTRRRESELQPARRGGPESRPPSRATSSRAAAEAGARPRSRTSDVGQGAAPMLKVYTQDVGGEAGREEGGERSKMTQTALSFEELQRAAAASVGLGLAGTALGKTAGSSQAWGATRDQDQDGIHVRVEEYGPVDGSRPANIPLRRLRYQGSRGVRSPEEKEQTSLMTDDIEGAVVLPVNTLKTQLGGGNGAWRKAERTRRHVNVTNQVADIAGEPEGRPKFDTMLVRTVRHTDPVQPVYQSLDGTAHAALAAPEGSFNPRHTTAKKLYEVDRRDTIRLQAAQQEQAEAITAVQQLA